MAGSIYRNTVWFAQGMLHYTRYVRSFDAAYVIYLYLVHRTLCSATYVACHTYIRNGFLKAAENFREEDMIADVSKYVTSSACVAS